MNFQQSAAFQYFISGAVASTGINLITGVVAESARNIDGLLLGLAGAAITALGYILSRRAAVYDHYEKVTAAAAPANLSPAEKRAIVDEHATSRNKDAQKLRGPIAGTLLLTIGIIVAREVLAQQCGG